MSDELLRVLTLISALGCGLVGGIFFAFSTFVMKALDRLPPAAVGLLAVAHNIYALQRLSHVTMKFGREVSR